MLVSAYCHLQNKRKYLSIHVFLSFDCCYFKCIRSCQNHCYSMNDTEILWLFQFKISKVLLFYRYWWMQQQPLPKLGNMQRHRERMHVQLPCWNLGHLLWNKYERLPMIENNISYQHTTSICTYWCEHSYGCLKTRKQFVIRLFQLTGDLIEAISVRQNGSYNIFTKIHIMISALCLNLLMEITKKNRIQKLSVFFCNYISIISLIKQIFMNAY